MKKAVARKLVHLITNIRKYQYEQVAKFAEGKKKKKILEIGSGKELRGAYHYSTKHLFDPSNDFLQTDIDKSFGHEILDVTKMKHQEEFDIILCLNVLEHVFDFHKAIKNLHKALKKGGTVIVAVPTFYPLHDEPGDYWRFSEHALRKLFADFRKVKLTHKGKRELPITYYLEATK